MAGKMSPKFVALCSLAVGAIYSTGYAITANSNSALAATTSKQSHATAPPSGKANNSSNSSSSGTSSNKDKSGGGDGNKQGSTSQSQSSSTNNTTTKKASSSPKTNTTQKYLDGTYNGSAQNRIGMVSVAVTIKKGKIGNVQITACDTHYPESYIDPVLPNYVVNHQSTNVPVVSGATLSTADFYYAVVQALSKAHNPNYKG